MPTKLAKHEWHGIGRKAGPSLAIKAPYRLDHSDRSDLQEILEIDAAVAKSVGKITQQSCVEREQFFHRALGFLSLALLNETNEAQIFRVILSSVRAFLAQRLASRL